MSARLVERETKAAQCPGRKAVGREALWRKGWAAIARAEHPCCRVAVQYGGPGWLVRRRRPDTQSAPEKRLATSDRDRIPCLANASESAWRICRGREATLQVQIPEPKRCPLSTLLQDCRPTANAFSTGASSRGRWRCARKKSGGLA